MYFTSNLTYGVIWATDCCEQCDQKKIDKCLEKLPKSDFTRKMNDFNAFKNCIRMWEIWANQLLPKA